MSTERSKSSVVARAVTWNRSVELGTSMSMRFRTASIVEKVVSAPKGIVCVVTELDECLLLRLVEPIRRAGDVDEHAVPHSIHRRESRECAERDRVRGDRAG